MDMFLYKFAAAGWGTSTPMPQAPRPPQAPVQPGQPVPSPVEPPAPKTPEQHQEQRIQDIRNDQQRKAEENAPGFYDRFNSWADETFGEPIRKTFGGPLYRHYKKNQGLYHTLGGLTVLGGVGGLVGGRKARKFLWPLALLSGLALAGTAWHGSQQEKNWLDKGVDTVKGWLS